MSLEIRESSQEGIIVLTLTGRLTVGESNVLREKISACQGAGNIRIVMSPDVSAGDGRSEGASASR